MRKFNIVKAKWEAKSIDERPLKVYTIVPNIMRFEFVLNEPKIKTLKANHNIKFMGNGMVEFKENDRKFAYVSIEDAPFRFEGTTAEMLKEISKNSYRVDELRNKFSEHEDFEKDLKHLLTLGIIDITLSKN